MPRAHANGIELEYATFGDRDRDRPLVLLRGLGTQMIQWDPRFCELLAEAGHFLVIFDNRDAGLSTWLDHAGVPKLAEVGAALREGTQPSVPYTLLDMADDVAGLMDALDLPTAHVAGISMGGMITQVVGARHPSRVRSLVPIMSNTGNPDLPPAAPEAIAALMEPAPAEREAFVDYHVRTAKVIGSPGHPVPDDERRAVAGAVFDRAFHPQGTARQFVAIQASGDRRPDVRTITAPTLVIHGLDDPLVHPEGGRDTAAHIPGAELLEIPGMGHDVPPGLFETLARAIAAHTEKAERERAAH